MWLTLLIALKFVPYVVGKSDTTDYCQSEFFEVSCRKDEVIMMEHARYGRMRQGRCITGNYGKLGCSVDVLRYMDGRCSGRSECKVYIADPDLHKLQTCPKDLTSYLEAKHRCLPVAIPRQQECRGRPNLPLRHPSGYMSSEVAITRHYGTGACPWRIEVKQGQTVRLTLYTFGGMKADILEQDDISAEICYEAGVVQERSDSQMFTICGSGPREKPVYQSNGNKVTMEFLPPKILKNLTPFIIRYEAQGCENLKAPIGSSITVSGNTAIMRCNTSEDTSFLTCNGTQWAGKMANCTKGILIVVAIGVALGIFCGGVLLSLVSVYMKKRQSHYEAPSDIGGGVDQSYQEPHKELNPTSSFPKESQYRVVCEERLSLAPCPTGTYGAPRTISDNTLYHTCGREKSAHVYESPQFT